MFNSAWEKGPQSNWVDLRVGGVHGCFSLERRPPKLRRLPPSCFFLSLQWYWDFKRTDSKSCGCPCQRDRIVCRGNWSLWQEQSQSPVVPAGEVKGSKRRKICLGCWVSLHYTSRQHISRTVLCIISVPLPLKHSVFVVSFVLAFFCFHWQASIWHEVRLLIPGPEQFHLYSLYRLTSC